MFILYAHRGASSYAPQNTMKAFRLGLEQGANGIETDIQKTKDGVLVLFHDDDMKQITGVDGKIADFTFSELQQFTVRTYDGIDTEEKIPTLREFLEFAKGKNIFLALEIKQDGIEADVISMIKEFSLEDITTVTSFSFEHVRNVKAIDPKIRVGYLSVSHSADEDAKAMMDIKGEEICPKAELTEKAHITDLHALGFGVRAWGVSDFELAKRMIDFGADGMTANFPDLCVKYLKETRREI